MHRHVGLIEPVHADHPEILRIGGRKGAEPHQGQGAGKAGQVDQLAEQLRSGGAGIDDAAAAIEQRPLGIGHQLDRLLDLLDVALDLRVVALVLHRGAAGIFGLGLQDVLRQIDHHRSRPAAARDIEGFVDRARQIADVLDEVVVLGAGPGDARGVRLLKGVIADQMGRHLPGEADDRHRIHQRIGQPGDRIGRPGARGHQHDSHLARGARIALRRMDGGLLMADEDMAERVLLIELVIERQHGAARIAENHLDALIQQRLDDDSRPRQFLCSHGSLLRSCHKLRKIQYFPRQPRETRGSYRSGQQEMANNIKDFR